MFILYKTTNLINGKVYVGIHEQSDPFKFDGYLGSGNALYLAIKKHGRANFIRETIFAYDLLEEAKIAEAVIVDNEFIAQDDSYNMVLGGGYPPVVLGVRLHTVGANNIGHRPEVKAKRSVAMKQRYREGLSRVTDRPGVREKMAASKVGNSNAVGRRNEETRKLMSSKSVGKRHFTNGVDNIRCYEGQQPAGYIIGRTI